MTPFQIIFTPTAAAELGTLPKELQLEILGDFRGLPNDVRSDEMDSFGSTATGGICSVSGSAVTGCTSSGTSLGC